MRFVGLVCVLTLAACAIMRSPAPAAAAPLPSYHFVDLADDYADLYDRTEGQSSEARVAAFKAQIVPLFPQFYGKDRFDLSGADYDARIARSFADFGQIRNAYRGVDGAFVSLLQPALASFAQTLPDMGPVGDIYLLNSFGEMDGGMREFEGRAYFVFGADMIARIHTPQTIRPFFHHELFHVYHQQYFAGCEQIWCNIWQEGLAVLAAAEINPDSSDDQLLLTMPEPIRPGVEANRAAAVCAVKSRLDSTNAADFRGMFNFDQLAGTNLPKRFGYYVGYLIAQEARRTHSLQELAHLNVVQARPVVDAAIAALATCP